MLNIPEEVRDFMEQRHFTDADLEEVVTYGEEGNCLVDEDSGHKLAKKRLENCTLYVEYTATGDDYDVVDGYSHRVKLVEDEEV